MPLIVFGEELTRYASWLPFALEVVAPLVEFHQVSEANFPFTAVVLALSQQIPVFLCSLVLL